MSSNEQRKDMEKAAEKYALEADKSYGDSYWGLKQAYLAGYVEGNSKQESEKEETES